MSEVWGQARVSVTPTGTGMTTNGPMNESGLKSATLLESAPLLAGMPLLASALLIASVMLIATGKIVALRTRKARQVRADSLTCPLPCSSRPGHIRNTAFRIRQALQPSDPMEAAIPLSQFTYFSPL